MKNPHQFHIPVMGTGHTADTPLRVAPFGISSVISIVDDFLLERLRKYYLLQEGKPYQRIGNKDSDGRAARITAYLNMVQDMVQEKLEAFKQQSIFDNREKRQYFELLPDASSVKKLYRQLMNLKDRDQRRELEEKLTDEMIPGAIDVNIMVKLDKPNFDRKGHQLSEVYSDAKAALRGFAQSRLNSSVVFSAGINQSLYSYMAQFQDFYRDASGHIRKKIILKVSEYRSALIQGKFLARLGLEVSEFRIESGLNCGGHAFGTSGKLLPSLLSEFKEKKNRLTTEFRGLIQRYYDKMDWQLTKDTADPEPMITVQGGIGNYGEHLRLMEEFGVDLTGWASPFLLVPEATGLDPDTRNQLAGATAEDLYLSDVSPLGIAFSNLRHTASEEKTQSRIDRNLPGSPCPKGYLKSNIEFTEHPICTASTEYQVQKLAQISQASDLSETEKERRREAVLAKTCICDQLGDSLLLDLGIKQPKTAAAAVCPGPNIEWFNREYTLKEMVDHIYGRGKSLVSQMRPHMFASEIELYVDYIDKQIRNSDFSDKAVVAFQKFRTNLLEGIDKCREIARDSAYANENLASISEAISRQTRRLSSIYRKLEEKLKTK